MLQKAGGSFTLTADVNFGPNFGLLSQYFTSRTSSAAASGIFRLANADSIGFRNAANSGDLLLKADSSNNLSWNGHAIANSSGFIPAASGGTGVDSSASSGIAHVATGTWTFSSIVNADISASAAIAYSKLTLTGAILNADLAGSIAASKLIGSDIATVGTITSGTWSATAISNAKGGTGADSSAQTGLAKVSSGTWSWATLVNADVAAGAAIAFSKLASLSTGQFLFGNAGVTTAGAMAGDATIDASGNLTIGSSKITAAKMSSGAATNGQVATANGSSGVTYTTPLATSRNGLLNSNFDFWQVGTSTTIANGSSTYQADQWYVKNSLGTNGVITFSQVTGVSSGALYGASVKITTAPTSGQTNGTELYQTLENLDSLIFYNQTASFTVQIKALGNVNQVGVQFYYKTTEAKVDTSIGSEVLTTVNSSTFTTCTISGQALGSSMTTAGVVGVRIRITGVSSGNTYDLNNGFVAEQAQMNIGSTAGTWNRAMPTTSQELQSCQRYYEKSYDTTSAPGTATAYGQMDVNPCGTSDTTAHQFNIFFRSTKRGVGSNVTVTIYSPVSGASGKCRLGGADKNASSAQVGVNGSSVQIDSTGGSTSYYQFQWAADARI